MINSRKKKDQEYLDEAIKDIEEVLLDLPKGVEYKVVKQEKKGQVVKNDVIFTGDLFNLLFPFICDMKELPKFKRLCRGIKIRVEKHIAFLLNTKLPKIKSHSVSLKNEVKKTKNEERKGEISWFFRSIHRTEEEWAAPYSVDRQAITQLSNEPGFYEVIELNLIEINKLIFLIEEEYKKAYKKSTLKRLKSLVLFNTDNDAFASKEAESLIVLASLSLTVLEIAALSLYFLHIEAIIFCIFLSSILGLLPVALVIINIFILSSIHIATSSIKTELNEFKCTEDILSTLKKIKSNDLLKDETSYKLKLTTIDDVKIFAERRKSFFENLRTALKENENKDSEIKHTNRGGRNHE